MKTSKIYRHYLKFPKPGVSLALALLLGVCPLADASSARIFSLSADEWARPRSGEIIPELASVRAAVGYWNRGSDAIVVIRYPGEDSGELWAAELRDWFAEFHAVRLSQGVAGLCYRRRDDFKVLHFQGTLL